jgi:hypothetical protein
MVAINNSLKRRSMEIKELENILERLAVKDLVVRNYTALLNLEEKGIDKLTPEESKAWEDLLTFFGSIKSTVKHEYPYVNFIKFWSVLAQFVKECNAQQG